VEGEDVPGARLGVERVGEVGFDARRFVEERQRAAPRRQRWRQTFGVLRRLHFYAAERRALLLRFDDAGGLAVDVEEVIGGERAAAGGGAVVGR
jgi:hypothetical protein